MGWPDYFRPVLENAAEVYNYYSSGDPIFHETDSAPDLTAGVFHWPTFRSEWDFVDFNATSNDVYLALAKYVPAISSPIGGGPLCITEGKSVDLNVDENSAEVIPRPNGWGRDGGVHRQRWLHSDMKDMAYFYVYELYEQLVIKGVLK